MGPNPDYDFGPDPDFLEGEVPVPNLLKAFVDCTIRYLYTECLKIYQKPVLNLLKYTTNLYLSRCSTDLR